MGSDRTSPVIGHVKGGVEKFHFLSGQNPLRMVCLDVGPVKWCSASVGGKSNGVEVAEEKNNGTGISTGS